MNCPLFTRNMGSCRPCERENLAQPNSELLLGCLLGRPLKNTEKSIWKMKAANGDIV
jgi:hypothetical protein